MLLLQKVRAARMRTAQGYCTQRAGTLYKALSLLYRSQDLQTDIRWKGLADLYKMQSFAQLSNLFFK